MEARLAPVPLFGAAVRGPRPRSRELGKTGLVVPGQRWG